MAQIWIALISYKFPFYAYGLAVKNMFLCYKEFKKK